MKKLLSSLLLLVFSISLAMIYLPSKANAPTPILGVNSLKQYAVKSFLQKANDPKSALHKKLLQVNQEHTDGRNSGGVLPLMTTADIQVVSIQGEDQFGFYCRAIPSKPQHSQCDNGVDENYLVLIPYKMSVHKAKTYDSIKFIIKVVKKAEWKMNENEKESDRHESIKIEEPVEAFLKVGSEKL